MFPRYERPIEHETDIDFGPRAPILGPSDPGRRKGPKKGHPPLGPGAVDSERGNPLKKGNSIGIALKN